MEAFIAHWGYLAILIGTTLEGEAVLIAAGAMAHHGLLSLPLVMLAAFAGGLAGDQGWFLLGRRYGTPWLRKRPAMLARVDVVHSWIEKYGVLFLIGFRFMYGLRTVTPVLLGASGYPERRFFLMNALGAAVWAASFGAIGYGAGASLHALLDRRSHPHELMLLGAVAAVVLALVMTWRVHRRRQLDAR